MFNPMPYQGYQQAHNPNNNNNNMAPPPYGEPPTRYAQFDNPTHRGFGKGGEDSLPAMPSWKDAQDRRVVEEGVEMGNLQKPALASNTTTTLPSHSTAAAATAAAEADSYPVTGPHEVPTGYTGPDFNTTHQTAYTGPDFSASMAPHHHHQYDQQPQQAYSAYAPSESTRYEPSQANEPQELGTTYSNTLPPPPSPSAQRTGFGGGTGAPGVLQAGRMQGQGQGPTTWRDV